MPTPARSAFFGAGFFLEWNGPFRSRFLLSLSLQGEATSTTARAEPPSGVANGALGRAFLSVLFSLVGDLRRRAVRRIGVPTHMRMGVSRAAAAGARSAPPEVLEAIRRQLCVPDGVLDVFVTQIGLD